MTQSYPSRPVVGIDVPEVKVFGAKFVYNYFTKDERINDSGDVDLKILQKSVGTFGQSFIDTFANKVPRFVQFNLKPVTLRNPSRSNKVSGGTTLSLGASVDTNLSIADNLKNIHSERQFTNDSFSAIGFQDTGIDGKLFLLTSGSLVKKINSNNERIKREIDRKTNIFVDKLDSSRISLADAVRFMNGNTDDAVSADFIFDSLNDISRLGAQFVDSSGQTEMINARLKEIKNVDVKAKINNKIVASALRTIAEDPLSIFTDEVQGILPSAEAAQNQIVRDSEPDSIDDNEFDFVVDFISRKKVSPTSFIPNAKVLGYIIDKFEVAFNGQSIEHEPIVIENNSTTTAIDFKVSYGATYAYSIKTVVAVEFLVTDETDDFYAAKVLVASSPSPRQIVECVENVPPPPPADFNVGWDHTSSSARLTWCFPLNRQRDIKRFQIFRRTSVEEPFQLIKEYDFDDSAVKTQGLESPNMNLVETVSSPTAFYLDEELSKDGNSFIYAVCSVDAHGLSSNYSMQFEVKFDKFANNIKKRLLSSSGAPKSYPNMFLNEDTFVDVIKDSGHTRLSIYFDPEYYAVTDKETMIKDIAGRKENPRSGKNVNLMATQQNGGFYKLQFINTDLQQSKTLDIMIDDLTEIGNKRQERVLGGVRRRLQKTGLQIKPKSPKGMVRPTGLKLGNATKSSNVVNIARGTNKNR